MAKFLSRFHSLNYKTLVVVKFAVVRVLIKKMNILHPSGWSALFTARPVGKEDVIWYYNRSVVYYMKSCCKGITRAGDARLMMAVA